MELSSEWCNRGQMIFTLFKLQHPAALFCEFDGLSLRGWAVVAAVELGRSSMAENGHEASKCNCIYVVVLVYLYWSIFKIGWILTLTPLHFKVKCLTVLPFGLCMHKNIICQNERSGTYQGTGCTLCWNCFDLLETVRNGNCLLCSVLCLW